MNRTERLLALLIKVTVMSNGGSLVHLEKLDDIMNKSKHEDNDE